jgi:hypothetical protein
VLVIELVISTVFAQPSKLSVHRLQQDFTASLPDREAVGFVGVVLFDDGERAVLGVF